MSRWFEAPQLYSGHSPDIRLRLPYGPADEESPTGPHVAPRVGATGPSV